MQFTAAALAVLLPLVAAQTTHDIDVGEGGLVFSPDSVTAAEGDTLRFHFYPMNHTITQSSFAEPCQQMADGINSGFVPTMDGVSDQVFTVPVTNASAPMWFFCAQGRHCQSGMVMAVNAPTSGERTLDSYKQASANAQTSTADNMVRVGSFGGNTTNSTEGGSPTSTADGAGASDTNAAGTAGVNWAVLGGAAILGAFAL